jgi:chromosome segregation ATPase
VDASAISSRLIGALLVEKRLITEAQLELALEEQQTTGARLGEVLMAQFGVTRADLESALTAQRAQIQSHGTQEDSDANAAVRELARMLDEWGRNEAPPKRPIGEIFVDRGFITSGQLEDALEEQKLSGRKLGEILVSQGKLSRLRLWDALEDQAASFETPKPEPSGSGLPGLRVVSDALTGTGPTNAETPVEMWQPPAPQPTRTEHTAQVPAAADESVTDLRDELAALAARLEELPQPSEQWREAVTELDGRVDELVDGSSESQSTLQRLAEQLEEERNADRELETQLSALAQRVDRLADDVIARIDQVAAGEVDELANRLVTLDENVTARLQHLTDHLSSAATRDQAERLRRELDDLRASLDAIPAPTDDVENLTRRVEQLAESFSARLQQLTEIANDAARRDQTDNLRNDLDQLRATLDNLPAPTDEWRDAVNGLNARLEHLSNGVADATTHDQTDAVRRELEDLRNRVEALPVPTDEWREAVAALAVQMDSAESSEEWRDAVAALAVRLDEVTEPSEEWRAELGSLSDRLRERIDRLEQDVAGAPTTEGIEVVSSRVGELGEGLERAGGRLDQVARRLEELAPLHRVEELADATAETASAHGAALDAIREELAAQARKAQEAAEKRRGDKAAVRERLDALETAVADTTSWSSALEPLQAHLADLDHRLEELASNQDGARRAELDALRDEVREELSEQSRRAEDALDARRAETDTLNGRLDRFESTIEEHAAGRDAERRADLDALRTELYQRVEQVAATTAGRSELDALRRELETEFGDLLVRQGQEDAAAQATGEAIRDGLAELARRLTASEQAYFESGRTLRRSIEGLGLAITDADWHLRTGAAADPEGEATSYVAFVPAGDAYRLVECDGPPPYLGQVVDIEGFEDVMLRVSRLGRSPLPFDGRPCAYLERLSA